MNLSTPISELTRLDIDQKHALERLSLHTLHDLLFYFPVRYSDISNIKLIRDITKGEQASITGTLSGLKTKKAFRTKVPMAEGYIEDMSGKMKVVWFNQPYIAKMIKNGEVVTLTGKISEGKNGYSMSNPEVEPASALAMDNHETLWNEDVETSEQIRYPIYPETRGISSKWIYHTISKIFKTGIINEIEEYIPVEILKKYNLPSVQTALVWIHAPKKVEDAEVAKKRFAFEEIFFIQLHKKIERIKFEENKGYEVKVDQKDIDNFTSRFPFSPTASQYKAIDDILEDFKAGKPMSRLLEGDVGSGKTAVAATACYAIIKNRPDGQSFGNLQIAYMAPTEILAVQHFESFIKYFTHLGVNIGLITGSGCRKFPSKVASTAISGGWTNISRAQLTKWVENGEVPIVIGTQALIQKSIKFKHLALVVIDEQHRFGTNQRSRLARKDSFAPHLLSMTATPIPRTLALTIYGDLDLSLLDEMPEGRKKIITKIITPDKRNETYAEIKKELIDGRQLYVICPRIDEPDPDKEMAMIAKSVTAEAKRLKKEIFQDYNIGILHSKMSKEKKEEVMMEFKNKEIDILVATSVVEVGVNVPNATVIIIEGAERFGLSQLHQLRGRVIRSNHQAYCYVFAEAKSEKTMNRLKALVTAKNGFELSELDLMLRGAGELAGAKQWGISDLAMEAIKNLKMVEAARNEATRILEKDKTLAHYPLIKIILANRTHAVHFE
jgi:ATP-dependent DNA helicase RecG